MHSQMGQGQSSYTHCLSVVIDTDCFLIVTHRHHSPSHLCWRTTATPLLLQSSRRWSLFSHQVTMWHNQPAEVQQTPSLKNWWPPLCRIKHIQILYHTSVRFTGTLKWKASITKLKFSELIYMFDQPLIETAHCDQINSMEWAMVLNHSSTSMKACMIS